MTALIHDEYFGGALTGHLPKLMTDGFKVLNRYQNPGDLFVRIPNRNGESDDPLLWGDCCLEKLRYIRRTGANHTFVPVAMSEVPVQQICIRRIDRPESAIRIADAENIEIWAQCVCSGQVIGYCRQIVLLHSVEQSRATSYGAGQNRILFNSLLDQF